MKETVIIRTEGVFQYQNIITDARSNTLGRCISFIYSKQRYKKKKIIERVKNPANKQKQNVTQSKHMEQSWETDSTLRYKEVGC